VSGAAAHLHLKGHKNSAFLLTLKSNHFNMLYKIISVGYFELKLHIHPLGTSNTYFTSLLKLSYRIINIYQARLFNSFVYYNLFNFEEGYDLKG